MKKTLWTMLCDWWYDTKRAFSFTWSWQFWFLFIVEWIRSLIQLSIWALGIAFAGFMFGAGAYWGLVVMATITKTSLQ